MSAPTDKHNDESWFWLICVLATVLGVVFIILMVQAANTNNRIEVLEAERSLVAPTPSLLELIATEVAKP